MLRYAASLKKQCLINNINRVEMKKNAIIEKVEYNGLLIISIGVAAIYWRFDTLHPGEIMTRLFTVALFITYGIFTQHLINSHKCMSAALKKAHHELMKQVAQQTAGWTANNGNLKWQGDERKPSE
jgi:hypothetical protein